MSPRRRSRTRRCALLLAVSLGMSLFIGCSSRDSAGDAPRKSAVNAAVPNGTREFADCSDSVVCPRIVSLPGATFLMGSPVTEAGRYDDEGQHTASVQPFAIGKFLVTRGQWSAFVKATSHKTDKPECAYAMRLNPTWEDPGFPQTDDHPVVCITWGEAHGYVEWLSALTGHKYRLLTDDEWEYAARASSTTAFPWGDAASHEHANYGKDSCCGPDTLGRDRWLFTSPVGSFEPNGFGLYDMHGNVSVWLETCADSAEKLPHPNGAPGCVYRYARGGLWGDRPQLMRSAAKNFAPPPGEKMTIANYRSTGFGLRVARDLP